MNILEKYKTVRSRSEYICAPLKTEDYVVQPVVDVSPPKWHLGHTTWFFETFILMPNAPGYTEFDPQYNFVFNSYYESVGARVIRTDRGNLSRPSVEEVMKYRRHVDTAMEKFLSSPMEEDLEALMILGLNHEEQHQELLYTDIKYILGHNPLMPPYDPGRKSAVTAASKARWVSVPEGIYSIGHHGKGFCFDNELGRHQVYLAPYAISSAPVSNAEYLEFINAGGYTDFRYWHAEGWDWVKTNHITAPMYWYLIDDNWQQYTWSGLQPLEQDAPVCHVSYYEAAAYAAWKGLRLPTEFEWEAAADHFPWGQRWEWTESAYLPYPGFQKAPGAIGEYNGKFMVNQMVLRGGSEVTPPEHSRKTYRNFFHAPLRWQFTGIRLAKS
ncbi:ergothioneine biosynthesis protein EgtB [Chitinophaga jiangningensis]|uniref:Ergothioneine biosynthesis protein EgtB n=1 Tax=Chitinophaga jiangningensis TaxID=1419482 RepID=A0A1M7L573_9BACT|nr:ergothioneine biosynthesis protein EgtB [Chitinophaga jiangningensis]SHM72462.1 ergothioneine biosynthesis protein EgtB [Chitinophaga jiangningensis]